MSAPLEKQTIPGMPVVVLAAGKGSRLGAFTDRLPKCLVRIGDRCLIDWTLQSLSAVGLREVSLVGGFAIETLRSHVGARATIELNDQWECNGMLSSYLAAGHRLREAGGIVHYGDVTTSKQNLQNLASHSGDIVVANNRAWKELWSYRFADPLADAESFVSDAGRLVDIGRRVNSYEEIQGQFMGLIKFSARGWKLFEGAICDVQTNLRSDDTTSILRRLLHHGANIDVVDMPGGWIEVDTAIDLGVANRILRENIKPHVWT